MVQRTWIAFLRAMNTGGRRLTNERLCAAVRTCGIDDPLAYQASGNVIFEDSRTRADVTAALEGGLEQELSYPVPVFLRSGNEVEAIATSAPFDDGQLKASEGKRQVIFLRRPIGEGEVEDLMALAPGTDVLVPDGTEIHWLPEAGVGRSQLDMGHLEELTGGVTVRTHGTVQRIAAKYL
ncbi:MAG: DUF1697 domain-containing protein [Nitriliruptorales bacterium]|nr:DUF1697 domain-containing protein [Nitriliruptorales bacterium]